MSFPLTELHPVMRHHLINYPETYYHNAPVIEPLDRPTGSSEAQHSSMAAETAQADVMPIVNNNEGEPGGPFSMDPFIDASKTVGPTYFGVLKIRNVSPEMQEVAQPLSPKPADL